jgi:hypothetical protein
VASLEVLMQQELELREGHALVNLPARRERGRVELPKAVAKVQPAGIFGVERRGGVIAQPAIDVGQGWVERGAAQVGGNHREATHEVQDVLALERAEALITVSPDGMSR